MEDNKPKILSWVILLAVIIVGGFFFARTAKAPEVAGPISLGVILPLTGDGAVYGEPALNVYQLAVDEINKSGGVGGRDLVLVVEDGKCNGKDGANAAQKLVNVDKVQIIIGGICSSESLAAVPIAEAGKVALFSPGASSPDLTGRSPYFFRDYPSDASQGRVLAELAYKKGWRTVAFIQESLDYPLGIFKAFDARFSELGGKTVKEEFPTGASDFRSSIAKLQSQKPDALFVDTQAPAASVRIAKQVKELKWNPPLLVADIVVGDPKTVSENKALFEGAFGAEFGVDPNNPKFQHLLESYKQKYNAELPYQAYGQTEYDALYLVKEGIAAVGLDGQKLAAWSRTIKDWDGASGQVTIEATGDRASGHVLKIVKDGKTELYTE
ncbi:MAG: ABC transporter substrate-binding protein [Candidatus Taylorbacteria bacterium]|nr:ABC transporter substrate-binding protein [Candidatus Taylorbacteria bacterium]